MSFGYATASSKPEAPRERVVLELTREATRTECMRIGAALARDVAEELGSAVKVDESVFRPEQPVYTPLAGAKPSYYIGDPLDVDALLASAPEVTEQHASGRVAGEQIPAGSRSKTLTSLAGSMRRRCNCSKETLIKW